MGKKLSKDERIMEILKLLKEDGEVDIKELSDQFSVSQLTIRTDVDKLSELVSEIKIMRTYGKAYLFTRPKPYVGTYYGEVKLKRCIDEKILIGAYVAEHEVNDDEHLLLDGGSTIFTFVQQLKEKNRVGLHIMSNSATLNEEFAIYLGAEYIQIGGILNQRGLVFTDCPEGENFYKPYGQANFKAIITGTGFSYDQGLTVNTPEIIEAKCWFINAASQLVFLIDHAKFFIRARKTVTHLGLGPEDEWLKEEKSARIVVDTNWEKDKTGKAKIAPDFIKFCEDPRIKEVKLEPEARKNYPLIRVFETTLLPTSKGAN